MEKKCKKSSVKMLVNLYNFKKVTNFAPLNAKTIKIIKIKQWNVHSNHQTERKLTSTVSATACRPLMVARCLPAVALKAVTALPLATPFTRTKNGTAWRLCRPKLLPLQSNQIVTAFVVSTGEAARGHNIEGEAVWPHLLLSYQAQSSRRSQRTPRLRSSLIPNHSSLI